MLLSLNMGRETWRWRDELYCTDKFKLASFSYISVTNNSKLCYVKQYSALQKRKANIYYLVTFFVLVRILSAYPLLSVLLLFIFFTFFICVCVCLSLSLHGLAYLVQSCGLSPAKSIGYMLCGMYGVYRRYYVKL